MGDSTLRGGHLMFDIIFFSVFISIIIFFATKILNINTEVREQTRENNLTTTVLDSTSNEYIDYDGNNTFDGTYTLTEVFESVINNYSKYPIYIVDEAGNQICIQNFFENTYGSSLESYITQGYFSELKAQIYAGQTDNTAQYICKIKTDENGSINEVYYMRKAL